MARRTYLEAFRLLSGFVVGDQNMKNHDPNYGDNITCYTCHDVFDARNDPHDMIENHLICGGCIASYDDEELAELIADR